MNCSPTLTAQEFKQLHNGLWQLDCMVQKLVHGNVHEGHKLAEILETLRDSLKGAYEQDSRESDRKYNHYQSVQNDLGLDAAWSMYEVDDLNKPHPFSNVTHVEYRCWGSKPVRRQIVGNTWAALYMAANACIRDSGDNHHIFIENFTQEDSTLILSTGS